MRFGRRTKIGPVQLGTQTLLPENRRTKERVPISLPTAESGEQAIFVSSALNAYQALNNIEQKWLVRKCGIRGSPSGGFLGIVAEANLSPFACLSLKNELFI